MDKARAAAAVLSLSAAGLSLIQSHEGLVQRVYLDPVGIPTVCYGHTGNLPKVGTRYSLKTCQNLLMEDSETAQKAVLELVKVPLTQHEYDALVSLVFNIGRPAFARSSLLRKLNAGDREGASAEFTRWVYAQGKKLPGLVKRREAEQSLFRGEHG